MNRRAATDLIFQTIGWPIGTGPRTPTTSEVEEASEHVFKSRVGLLFLEEVVRRGVPLGDRGAELYKSLALRRSATNGVMAKLAARLDEVAAGEWVLFKSVKPFASTPNDTDWFPLDARRHRELCDHLLATGDFELLEKAPRQTTLIESGGRGATDTTKKGGIYYIDCYVIPSTDYFVYLDTSRLRDELRSTVVGGREVPVLSPQAELSVTAFHNVFPERSFTHESYYLIKSYVEQIDQEEGLATLTAFARAHKVEYALACNLVLVQQVDQARFGSEDPRIVRVLRDLGYGNLRIPDFDPLGPLPYEFSNRNYWHAFLVKHRDPAALRSSGIQALHMLNPVFFADVLKVVWRRSVRGGVYEQN